MIIDAAIEAGEAKPAGPEAGAGSRIGAGAVGCWGAPPPSVGGGEALTEF
ncbi:MAG: hypothetical protein AAB899_03320 [Patescibacteria group bacterium]